MLQKGEGPVTRKKLHHSRYLLHRASRITVLYRCSVTLVADRAGIVYRGFKRLLMR